MKADSVQSPHDPDATYGPPPQLAVRPDVIPTPTPDPPAAGNDERADDKPFCPPSSYITWAISLRRVFNADPLACPRCASPMRVLAAIFAALGLPTDPPARYSAHPPPQLAFDPPPRRVGRRPYRAGPTQSPHPSTPRTTAAGRGPLHPAPQFAGIMVLSRTRKHGA